MTRWTNLYFPARLGLFGDFVGGPLREVLGYGICDVSVSSSRWWRLAGWTPVPHTSYWLPHDAQEDAPVPSVNPVPPWV